MSEQAKRQLFWVEDGYASKYMLDDKCCIFMVDGLMTGDDVPCDLVGQTPFTKVGSPQRVEAGFRFTGRNDTIVDAYSFQSQAICNAINGGAATVMCGFSKISHSTYDGPFRLCGQRGLYINGATGNVFYRTLNWRGQFADKILDASGIQNPKLTRMWLVGSGNNAKAYLDQSLWQDLNVSSTSTVPADCYLGVGYSSSLDGVLYWLRVYSRVLSMNELAMLDALDCKRFAKILEMA